MCLSAHPLPFSQRGETLDEFSSMAGPLEDSYKYISEQESRLKADNKQQEAVLRKGQAKITWAEVGWVAKATPSFVAPDTGKSIVDKHIRGITQGLIQQL